MKKLVYVAGPLTNGSEILNTRKAIQVAFQLRDAGFVPLVPHLSVLAEIVEPHNYEWWLMYDFDMLERCDLMIRLRGESSGADRENKFASRKKIPVYYSVEELIEKEDPEL